MEITLKLSEVLKLNTSLSKIINSNIDDGLLKFKILGILNTIEPLVANYKIIRAQKINQYGKPSKDNEGQVVITPDDTDAIRKFNEDMTELFNGEVIINIEKLKANYIFAKGLDVDILVGLYPIIEE